jgi:hypothetical protein
MTVLNNERLDAVMTEVMLSEAEAESPETVCIPGYGIIHHFAFKPERLEARAEDIHQMLLELGPSYRQVSDDHPENKGGMSFLNMCMTESGVQWTGLHAQQEKLFALGCASGWAISPMPKIVWHMLPGGMPYFIVLNERREVTDRATVREMLDNVLASSMGEDTVKVATARCVHCGRPGEVTMPKEAYKKWKAGAFVQQAWPEGSAGEREQLINGTHPKCFDEMFPPEED